MLAHNASMLETESAFDVLARAQSLISEGRQIINLGIGQPDFKTSPHIVEAAIRALVDGHHGYTPAPGLPDLRKVWLLIMINTSVKPLNHRIFLWFQVEK